MHMYTRFARTAAVAVALALPASVTLAQQPAQAGAAKTASAAAALDDATIVAIFDAANTWDVESGALAASKAQSKDVRDFGAMLQRDHKMVRQLGRDLAAKLGVTPTPPADFGMAADHANAMKALRGASGAGFDRAFLQHEVAFHKAVLDAMNQTLVPAIHNAELRALVLKVAPAFEAHMMAAQKLLDKQAR